MPTVPTRTRVVVLQHPHERLHPFGTARLVGLCMPNAEVHTAYGGLAGVLRCQVPLPADVAVLFPHASAQDLEALPAAEHPSTLVVLDGTWTQARRLYRDNPWLEQLRHVRLHPAAPSRYRIRREPRADYVSTIEAIVQALTIVEPDTPGLPRLLDAFDHMVDQQIEHLASVPRHGRSKRPRQRPSRALSPLLDDPRLVLAYAESSLPGGDPGASRELLQWVAVRVDTGATFEAVLLPTRGGPSPYHLQHMGLTTDDLAAGETLVAARARFVAFAGRNTPIAAWTQTTLDWGAPMCRDDMARTVLKTSYCNLRNQRANFLDDVLAREGLAPADMPVRGRAARRLGNALVVARWLQSLRAGMDVSETPTGAP
jgi:DTW domain-containing protein YfiP